MRGVSWTKGPDNGSMYLYFLFHPPIHYLEAFHQDKPRCHDGEEQQNADEDRRLDRPGRDTTGGKEDGAHELPLRKKCTNVYSSIVKEGSEHI